MSLRPKSSKIELGPKNVPGSKELKYLEFLTHAVLFNWLLFIAEVLDIFWLAQVWPLMIGWYFDYSGP